MDRGAWQATVHRVVESEMTEATEHIHKQYDWVHKFFKTLPINY